MADLFSYKCIACGGDVRFNPATGDYKCEYCGSRFTEADLEDGVDAVGQRLLGLESGLTTCQQVVNGAAIADKMALGHPLNNVGIGCVGNEDLRAVQDPLVASVDGGRLLHGGIGAGVGLGQTESANPFTRGEFGQILHLLFLGAVLQNGSHAQRGVGREDDACGGAHSRQFFDGHDVHLDRAACATVLLRNRDAHQSEFAHLFDGLHREALLLIDFGGQRLYFILRKRTDHLQEELFCL